MRLRMLLVWAALAAGGAGCAGTGPPHTHDSVRARPRAAAPVVRLKIPVGHHPPPGQCRVWVPGRAPGRQADSSACFELQGQIPPGAWVLYRPPGSDHLIEVTAYHRKAPRRVLWVRYFEAGSGLFLSEVEPN